MGHVADKIGEDAKMPRRLELGSGLRAEIERYYPNIAELVLYINSNCNLRCKHCYLGDPLLNQSLFFPTDDVCAFISEFSHLDRVTILGGEPLLHRGINRIIQRFAGP